MPCRRSSAKSRIVSSGIDTMIAIQNAGLPGMYVFIGSRNDDSSLRGALRDVDQLPEVERGDQLKRQQHEIGHRPQEIGGELASQQRENMSHGHEASDWASASVPWPTTWANRSSSELRLQVDLTQRPAVRHQLVAHRFAQVFRAPRAGLQSTNTRRPREPALARSTPGIVWITARIESAGPRASTVIALCRRRFASWSSSTIRPAR